MESHFGFSGQCHAMADATWSDVGPQCPSVPPFGYLVTMLQVGHIHGREIQQRGAQSRSTWGALSKPFYNKTYVSLATKAKVFQATALSQFMYNAHIWTGVTPIEWDKWHAPQTLLFDDSRQTPGC